MDTRPNKKHHPVGSTLQVRIRPRVGSDMTGIFTVEAWTPDDQQLILKGYQKQKLRADLWERDRVKIIKVIRVSHLHDVIDDNDADDSEPHLGLADSDGRPAPVSLHPTHEDYPIGTRILWQLNDEGRERDGVVFDWSADRTTIFIQNKNINDGFNSITSHHPSDVFVNAVTDPSGVHCVSVRNKQNEEVISGSSYDLTPKLYPEGTRLSVSIYHDSENVETTDVLIRKWHHHEVELQKIDYNPFKSTPPYTVLLLPTERVTVHKVYSDNFGEKDHEEIIPKSTSESQEHRIKDFLELCREVKDMGIARGLKVTIEIE